MESRQLKDILAEAIDNKNFNIKKLSEITGIHERHLKLLLEGGLRKLPPAPYVRGYLTKISQALGLDRDELYQIYKNEIEGFSSGPEDRLPGNRFVIRSSGKKIIFYGILGLAIASYLLWNMDKLLGVSYLEVIYPDEDSISVFEESIVIEGKTDFSNKLTINNEQIYLDKDGHFKKEYSLQEGLNTFEIISKKFLGRESRVMKKVIKQAIEEQSLNIINSSSTKR